VRKRDRDGAAKLLASIRSVYPWLRHVFADGGYAGDKLRGELTNLGRWTVQVIKRSDTAKGFEVLPRRWVVERTLAWINRCRRLAKDFEATVSSASAWVLIAHKARAPAPPSSRRTHGPFDRRPPGHAEAAAAPGQRGDELPADPRRHPLRDGA
jgi:transposase